MTGTTSHLAGEIREKPDHCSRSFCREGAQSTQRKAALSLRSLRSIAAISLGVNSLISGCRACCGWDSRAPLFAALPRRGCGIVTYVLIAPCTPSAFSLQTLV
jgi:hypothetical protein